MRLAAARLINLDYFSGDRFSWGDEFLSDCARGVGGPGNSTTWRAVNMNHHMTRALADISSFYGRRLEQPSERQTPFQEELQF
jgi:hypothetical protein